MLDAVYEWIKNIAFYLLVMTAVLEALPGNDYRKYIRFFAGTVLILLVITPALRLSGAFGRFEELYESREYEWYRQEIKLKEEYLKSADIFDFIPEEYLTEEQTKGQTKEQTEAQTEVQTKENVESKAEGETKAGAETGGNRIEVEEIRIGEADRKAPVMAGGGE